MNATTSATHGQLRTVSVLDDSVCPGVGAHVCSLAHGLVARGVEVTVCGPVRTESEQGFSRAGARFRTVELGCPASARDEAAAMAVLRHVCSSADVVHAHGTHAGILAAFALRTLPGRRHRRTPLVVTLHSAASRSARLPFLLERRVVRAADIVLGASSDLVAHARSLGAKDARLAPVAAPKAEPALEVERVRQEIRAEFGSGDRPLLLSVGRLTPEKGHGVLLDAARTWRGADPQPLLVVSGEGPEQAALQDRIDAEHLPVRLLGRREDVPELLAAADVVVLASQWEGRSLLAQEALRTGVPLVATAVGGIPELVGDAAVLVPYGDAEALGQAVAGLLADPARRAALAEQGIAQAATWPDEDDTVAQVLSIYDELALPHVPAR
ncbi:glycosyltransferase family 4 protein [Wenjunlia tyrosinilytica]|uniref:glycosyltransferase family 4 protein n=1 Tax=Wenjunlia tyrosinilytica TaxID=1544741 RepID=UPI001E3F22CF|nr:glycosyltransferase family 4 protein [Wenjunlia tyrosinilytica]